MESPFSIKNHKSKYEVRCRDGNIVGLCDDYEGFVAIVKAVSPSHDLGFPHNTDKTEFCAIDACNNVLYVPAPTEQ